MMAVCLEFLHLCLSKLVLVRSPASNYVIQPLLLPHAAQSFKPSAVYMVFLKSWQSNGEIQKAVASTGVFVPASEIQFVTKRQL